MTEYQDEEGNTVLAKKSYYSVFLKEKGWVLPFISAHSRPGYIVKTEGKPIWFDSEQFEAIYTMTEEV